MRAGIFYYCAYSTIARRILGVGTAKNALLKQSVIGSFLASADPYPLPFICRM